MKGKKLYLIAATAGIALLFAGTGFADVPPPPVNQTLGFYDTVFGNLQEADCRVCHGVVADRHHVLYGQPIPPGSIVPNPDADGDGVPDTHYGCLNCHDQAVINGVITFLVERDCLVCHTSTPHHDTADAVAGDCVSCHGDLVDNMGDGHVIPTYAPSLVTPEPSDGNGLPLNSEGNGAGACNYCHDADSLATPVIEDNHTNHHSTGPVGSCNWCHKNGNPGSPDADRIRTCEGCHGFESLHNIQADSNGGGIVVGGELAGYGHVGRDAGPGDSDCWGCHGFSTASAPGSGPIIPSLSSADVVSITAGTNTAVTLIGAAFTNIAGVIQYTSDVAVTAADGSSVTLTPESITQDSLTVVIPGSLGTGSYDLRVVKADVESNPVAIDIVPAVEITAIDCSDGTLTVTGSGFGDAPPEGTEDYLNVEVGGVPVVIVSWTDTEIVADVFSCSGTVTVNALFGSASAEGSGCEVCAADTNNDGTVDLFDLIILINEFLRTDCNTNPCQADCDGNGQVDIFDVVIMKLQFLKGNCCLQ